MPQEESQSCFIITDGPLWEPSLMRCLLPCQRMWDKTEMGHAWEWSCSGPGVSAGLKESAGVNSTQRWSKSTHLP